MKCGYATPSPDVAEVTAGGILIHSANDAATELQGCIAPVTKHKGAGKGKYSRLALARVESAAKDGGDGDEVE